MNAIKAILLILTIPLSACTSTYDEQLLRYYPYHFCVHHHKNTHRVYDIPRTIPCPKGNLP